MALKLPSNKSPGWRLYNISDYKWDLKHGYIQHAMYTTEASESDKREAWAEMMEEFHHAMLTTTGGEPQSRKQAVKTKEWEEPVNGWKVREQEEIDSLIDMGVIEWVPEDECLPGTKFVGNKFVYTSPSRASSSFDGPTDGSREPEGAGTGSGSV